MTHRPSLIIAALAVFSAAAVAQGAPPAANCGFSVTNSCQAKVDLFGYLTPQVGTLVAGGNATPGRGGTSSGFRHFSVGLRVNALQASLPDFRGYAPSASGARETFRTSSKFVALPVAEASVGVYAGYPLGLTRIGGVDLLGDASYLPAGHSGSTRIELPDGGAVYGYGVRLGLLQEGLLTPGVGITWLRHELPTMAIEGAAAGTTLRIEDIDLATTSWRVAANKSLIAFGVAAGIGQDRYKASATVNTSSGPSTALSFMVRQDVTRTSWFADVSTNILLAKVVAEIGGVSGGRIVTYNSFAGKSPDAIRLHGSLGVRIGI